MSYLREGDEPPKNGKGRKLSAKMERFVEEYLIDLNASAAVLRAGYKTRNQNRLAAELMRHPLVKAAIEERMEDRRERMELTADYLLNKLVAMIEKEGVRDSDALRAIELAGKSLALWKDRQEISGPDGEAIKMEQQTEQNVAEFKSKLDRLARRAGTAEVVEFPKPGGDEQA